jgi:hypothetical protein
MRLRLCAALAAILGSFLIAAPAHAAATLTAAGKYSGSGDDLVEIRPPKDRGIVKFTHSGEANFIVWALSPTGKKNGLLVNTIGDYSGTVVLNQYSIKNTRALEIQADGDWTAEVLPISYAPTWKTATIRSAGPKVLKLRIPIRGLHSMRYRHSGERNFIVQAYPSAGSPDLLVNKIGSVSGRVVLPAGTRYVSVEADGPWYLVRK